MIKFLRKLNTIAALVIVSALLCCTSFAEVCGLRVTVRDEQANPVGFINVELVKVVDYEGGHYNLMPDFEDYPVGGDEVSNVFTVEQAERVYQYVLANGISGEVKITNSSGYVDYGDLDEGIFLVFERGRQAISFQPYLVRLPIYTTDGPMYSLNSEPKTIMGATQNVLVMLSWDDEDNAAGARPESVDITLQRNGTPLRKVALNETCAWEHTFHLLPRTGGEYTLLCPDIQNYTLIDIYTIRNGYIVEYKYTPPVIPEIPDDDDDYEPVVKPKDEEGDKIPQTGFELIPLYVIMTLGAAMVILGMADLYFGREDQ